MVQNLTSKTNTALSYKLYFDKELQSLRTVPRQDRDKLEFYN
jgi:hypothetical protein